MKKFLFVLSLIIATNVAFAEGKCEDGIPFEGVQNGHNYCISSVTMTWWAAFAWCQHQGRHLASLQEACDGWHGTTGDAACKNFIKNDFTVKSCWTANSYTVNNSYRVFAGNGNIDTSGYHTTGMYALCY